jgi:hypothetical protein
MRRILEAAGLLSFMEAEAIVTSRDAKSDKPAPEICQFAARVAAAVERSDRRQRVRTETRRPRPGREVLHRAGRSATLTEASQPEGNLL